MPNALVPLQTGASPGHIAFGLMVVVAAALAVAALVVKKDDGNLTREQQQIRDQVRAALDEPAATARFSAPDIRSGAITASDIRERLETALTADGSDAPETPRQAYGEIRSALGTAWGEATADIPKHALALGEWALLVVVWGTIAVATGTIITALSWESSRMTLGEYLSYFSTVAANGAEMAVSLAFQFPFADVLWSLGFAYGILLIDAIYHYPWGLAALLLLAAAGMFVLERRLGDGVPEPTLVRKRFVLGAVGAAIAVWTVGTVVTVFASPLLARGGVGWLGHVLGFLAAVGVAGIFAWIGLQEATWRVRSAAASAEATIPQTAGVLGARAVAGFLRPVAILAVAAYIVTAIATGRLLHVIQAAIDASIEVKVIVVASAFLLGYILAHEVGDAGPEVRRALVELQARERARASAALASVPYVGVVFAFAAGYAFQLPLVVSVLLAILAGVGFRLVVQHYHRLRRAHADEDDGYPPTGSLLASCRVAETHAGERYLVTIGGTLYAHEDRQSLIDTCVDVLQARAHGDDPDPTIDEWFARNLCEFGQGDYRETYHVDANGFLGGKLAERTRKELVSALRDSPDRRRHRDDLLDDDCEDIPDAVARRRLAELLTTPALRQHADGTVRLKKDIWSQMVDDTHDVDTQRAKQAI
jgi:hypothetical protein